MITKPFRPFLSGALLLGAVLLPVAGPRALAQATGYAAQVLDYVPGTSVSTAYTNAASALGKPGGSVGSGTLNPFSPNYAGSELTAVGVGGQLTLGLSNFVTVGAAGVRELGIFGNVGLVNANSSAPQAANPATAFGIRSVLISVSADGLNFVPLNGGGFITSTVPANYYTNADTANVNAPPPANPTLADFGKPFVGSLSSFDGQTYSQILGTLDGSAGGTWLDLSATGLSQVGYIRFNEPASGGQNGGVFYLNGVSLNGSLLGAAIPEPSALALCAVAAGLLALLRRRWRQVRPAAVAVAVAASLWAAATTARAQMLGFADIQNWTGTGSNQAALVVDWNDGKSPESLVWGFRWNGTATGLDMFRAIDLADPRLALFTGTDPNFGTFVYGIGYDLNGNGGTFTPGTPRSNETGFASDPGDHYAEGFFTKYWAYYNSDNGSPYGGTGAWVFGENGAGGRTLVNGSWDGYSISDANFNAPNPDFPAPAAAVPEPSTVCLIALAAGGLLLIVHRRTAKPLVA